MVGIYVKVNCNLLMRNVKVIFFSCHVISKHCTNIYTHIYIYKQIILSLGYFLLNSKIDEWIKITRFVVLVHRFCFQIYINSSSLIILDAYVPIYRKLLCLWSNYFVRNVDSFSASIVF